MTDNPCFGEGRDPDAWEALAMLDGQYFKETERYLSDDERAELTEEWKRERAELLKRLQEARRANLTGSERSGVAQGSNGVPEPLRGV